MNKILILIALSLVTFYARSEIAISELVPALQQIYNGKINQGEYESTMADLESANAASLFYAAGVSFYQKKEDIGTFLLLAGQIRSTSDIAMLEPSTEAGKETAAQLWAILYYKLGGAGNDSFYREKNNFESVKSRLNDWNPKLKSTYKPGWTYTLKNEEFTYDELLENQKANRIEQLASLVKLLSNDEYYEARKELHEIQARNLKGIDINSPDGKRLTELQQIMKKVEDNNSSR